MRLVVRKTKNSTQFALVMIVCSMGPFAMHVADKYDHNHDRTVRTKKVNGSEASYLLKANKS